MLHFEHHEFSIKVKQMTMKNERFHYKIKNWWLWDIWHNEQDVQSIPLHYTKVSHILNFKLVSSEIFEKKG